MNNVNRFRIRYLSACIMAGVLGYGSPTTAAKPVPNPDFEYTYDKGLACSDFALRIVGSGGQQVSKQFVDKNGNLVRLLSAGTGLNYSYEALDEGDNVLGTFSTKSNGVVTQIKPIIGGEGPAHPYHILRITFDVKMASPVQHFVCHFENYLAPNFWNYMAY